MEGILDDKFDVEKDYSTSDYEEYTDESQEGDSPPQVKDSHVIELTQDPPEVGDTLEPPLKKQNIEVGEPSKEKKEKKIIDRGSSLVPGN